MTESPSNEPDEPGPQISPIEESDMLAGYRERIMYLMAIAGVIFLTPFAINDFIQGRGVLGASLLTMIAIMAVDAVAIHLKKHPPIPFALLLIPTAVCIGLSLSQLGYYGLLWSYPAVLFSYFVLPRRTANIGSFGLGLLAAVMVYVYVGQAITVRFVVSLTLTIVIINIILNIIGQLQRELMGQAITDPLTGAFNRRQMDLSLAEAIERNRRTGAPVSMLFIDIDHFKKINDDFGHDRGDRVLKGLVKLLNNRARKLDRLFRMGGEEFMLLLPDTRANAAMTYAESLRKLISEASLITERPVTVSIGVAEYWAEQTQDTWMKAADEALYQAKTSGRNKVVCGSADTGSIPSLTDGERRYGQR